MKTVLRIIVILEFLFSASIFSQQSGSQYYRTGMMDGNNIKTVFGNWGVIGQPSSSNVRGAWKYPTNGYIGDESFFIGVEFPIKDYNNDGINEIVHSVISCPVQRPTINRDTDPTGTNYWTFMPVDSSGKLNSQTVAMSNDNSTWPVSWNGVWKGIEGKSSPVGDLESYFQVNDMNDHRYDNAVNNMLGINFTGRNGQGITVDIRYIQLSNPEFSNVFIRVYDIKNENNIAYNKIFFGHLMGTYIGVSGPGSDKYQEYDDDYSIFYKKENVVISGDFPNDNSRNPMWKGSVGKMGSTFLIAPNNNAIASYNYFVNGSGQVDLRNDENLWQRFVPGTNMYPRSIINDTTVLAGEDGDYTMGTGYFSLIRGESKRVVSVIAYGDTKEEIFHSIAMARIFVGAGFDFQKMNSSITIKSITDNSNSKIIEWQTTHPGGTIDVYFSSDNGVTFSRIAENEENDGLLNWNTSLVADCYFGKIMVVAKDSTGNPIGFKFSERTGINNISNGLPYLRLVTDMFQMFIDQPEVNISFLIGDPDNASVTLKTFYNVGDGFLLFDTREALSKPNEQKILLNVDKIPNCNSLKLKFELFDGLNTSTFITPSFKKQIQRIILDQSNVQFVSKNTTVSVHVNIFEPNKTTNDSYKITFCDTAEHGEKKNYSIKNITSGVTVVNGKPFVSGTETDQFDGLTLMASDVETKLDSFLWSKTSTVKTTILFNPIVISLDPNNVNSSLYPYLHPCDYKVVYYDHIVDTSLGYYGAASVPLKYKVFNTTVGKEVNVVANEELGESFFFENVHGKELYTWYLLTDQGFDSLPKPGDTLFIRTVKGISSYDTMLVKNIALSVGVEQNIIPGEYSLSQNYPNPFNPNTTINYELPKNSFVSLKVFDLLGREVVLLVNETRNAGTYSASFDASKLSSGVYFYSLTAGSFSSTKKMMLIK